MIRSKVRRSEARLALMGLASAFAVILLLAQGGTVQAIPCQNMHTQGNMHPAQTVAAPDGNSVTTFNCGEDEVDCPTIYEKEPAWFNPCESAVMLPGWCCENESKPVLGWKSRVNEECECEPDDTATPDDADTPQDESSPPEPMNYDKATKTWSAVTSQNPHAPSRVIPSGKDKACVDDSSNPPVKICPP